MQTNKEAKVIPETNKYYSNIYSEDFIYIPRIYGGLNGVKTLVEKDGSNYKGYLKSFKIGSQTFTLTENGRWFDNSGMPCQCPKTVTTRVKQRELLAELSRLDGEKKWQDYKRKVFKK
jgi:hypothetical protein